MKTHIITLFLSLLFLNSYSQSYDGDLSVTVNPVQTIFNVTQGNDITLKISYTGTASYGCVHPASATFFVNYYLKNITTGVETLIKENDNLGFSADCVWQGPWDSWNGSYENNIMVNIPCSISSGNYYLSYKIVNLTYYSDIGLPPSYVFNSTNTSGSPVSCSSINCTLNNIAQVNITSSTPNLTISTTSTNLSCSMSLNGTATVYATGGTGSYTYKWSNYSTSQTIIYLSEGIYSVTVNSGNLCKTSSVTITKPDEIVTTISTTGALCGGGGSATVTAYGGTPPYTYKWNTNPQQTTATATNLNVGNYTITVTDANGCTKTQNVTINTNDGNINLTTNPDGHYFINTNVVWDAGIGNNPFNATSEIVVDDNMDIIIEANASLTIKNLTLKFGTSSGFWVRGGLYSGSKGAKLILNNTTLTSTCNNIMWNGVSLDGPGAWYPQIPFSNTRQPFLNMNNNSKIENAIIGVGVQDGAIIYAKNSTFRNNKTATYFSTNNNSNLSYFSNCNFITDATLNDPTLVPLSFVYMWQNKDVKFYYNTFQNTYSGATTKGIGIESYNSSFKVMSSCSTLLPAGTPCPDANVLKNTFSNLAYAIKAQGGSYITIDKCDFTNNNRAVYIKAINNATITRNTFDVGNTQADTTYGLYLHGCRGYKIEENTFKNGLAGMFVNNSGNVPNIVYNNKFENLSASNAATAAIALNINSNYWDNFDEDYDDPTTYIGNSEGLQFKCNKFSNNEYSLAVINGGIAFYQGNNSIDPTQLAGNTFSHNNPSVASDFYIENTDINQKYKYFEHDSYSTKLMYYTSSKIDAIPVAGVTYIESKACPSSFINKKSVSVSSAEYELQKMLTDVSNMEYDLQKNVDNGNKQLLLDLISSVKPHTFNSLCNELLSSQYLSDEVLEAFIDVPITGQYNRKTDVLLKNSPLQEKIKPLLATISYPQHFIDLLMQAQNGINAMEQKEGEILALKTERGKLLTDITIESVNNDSVPEVKDSLINLLKKESDYRTNMSLITILINEERYSETDVQLDLLQSQIHSLPQSKQSEINDWIQLQQIVKQVNYKTLGQLREVVKPNMGFLEKLALQENKMGCETAQVLIEESQYGNYYEPIKLPSANNPKSMQINNQGTKSNVNYNTIDIYPNPATNQLNINTDYNIDNSIVKIYNTLGVLVKETNLTNVYSIDVSDLSKGIYMLHVYSSNEHYTKLIKIIK
ncbi:MAG: hypothetical protein A2033_15265 [Bacteroidetes bacterium GWA2_31_9]|nr:MAG: hypothetical protein A2033_15265 [Bacteroidetes bacterium GWA2_31_9]